ncbi:hypothetical protein BKA56DRAFT_367227 [Ilyonectria sp. MPI-CAGE-AT-0026]|nr:hypothetical protein BKA56DRAFT_367227 [Ilyonectria sp. MPI-CAGE-AT-0026]
MFLSRFHVMSLSCLATYHASFPGFCPLGGCQTRLREPTLPNSRQTNKEKKQAGGCRRIAQLYPSSSVAAGSEGCVTRPIQPYDWLSKGLKLYSAIPSSSLVSLEKMRGNYVRYPCVAVRSCPRTVPTLMRVQVSQPVRAAILSSTTLRFVR